MTHAQSPTSATPLSTLNFLPRPPVHCRMESQYWVQAEHVKNKRDVNTTLNWGSLLMKNGKKGGGREKLIFDERNKKLTQLCSELPPSFWGEEKSIRWGEENSIRWVEEKSIRWVEEKSIP
ncbi:hypothetical protein K435DRAFT_838225 [Dendrothele bispora CBS 962.96]|uniref:Uncharacterized protein n=1 Tax=Dendrothele bispora (strain CBS 962.96) TaxID=1314807 RepID=A0A4V6T5H3_DENBC|nr:hypothetical protein K435DRAFT_838225 [Dendrothele bispora CBS 962.96]